MATSKKTMFLDILQLKSLNFKTANNSNIPSSFVLYSVGNGTTNFAPLSTLITDFYLPGQNYVASTMMSTNYSALTYPNIASSLRYSGTNGTINMSTLANNISYSNSGNALFSTFQYNFSNFTQYIKPNGSTKMYLDFYPNFSFSAVLTPSSISSVTLYPEGKSSIKSLLAISSHLIYTNTSGVNVTLPETGSMNYIPVTSAYPYGLSSLIQRPLSNTYNTPIRMEVNSGTVLSNSSNTFGLVHYLSDAVAYIKGPGFDVARTGLERSTVNVQYNNKVFVNLYNSPNVM
jgi:hypothetical protein